MRELIETIEIRNEYLADQIMRGLKKENSNYEFDVMKRRHKETNMVGKVQIDIYLKTEIYEPPTENKKKVGY